jgi:antitoxin (DNA-binding transcriptional repressor) of toxin-antitoxin stability system
MMSADYCEAMTRHVSLYQAKTHLSRLVDEASNGETIVIAKAGKPMAQLGPMSGGRKQPRRLGQLAPRSGHVDWEVWWRDWKKADREIEADFDTTAARAFPAEPRTRQRRRR